MVTNCVADSLGECVCRGGVLQNGRGAQCSFTPIKRGGAEHILAILKGAHQQFLTSLTWVLDVLTILGVGAGGQCTIGNHPLKVGA